jgi:hypothetical protein
MGRSESGQLTMLENVMSYDNYGIYVGTTEIIPEPTAASMVATFISFAGFMRRKYSRTA